MTTLTDAAETQVRSAQRANIDFAGYQYSSKLYDNGKFLIRDSAANVIIDSEDNPQAAKALVAGLRELQELQDKLATHMITRPQFQLSADEIPPSVELENGKYTFTCVHYGDFDITEASLLRYG